MCKIFLFKNKSYILSGSRTQEKVIILTLTVLETQEDIKFRRRKIKAESK